MAFKNRQLMSYTILVAFFLSGQQQHAVRAFSPPTKQALDTSQSIHTVSPHQFQVNQKNLHNQKNHHQEAFLTQRGGANTKLTAWPLTKNCDPKGVSPDYPLAIARISITIASTFFTWYAQRTPHAYTNVMASSAFTLICSMLFDKRLGQAAFCGTFAGMCSSIVMPSWQLILALGAVTSILFEGMMHYRNAFLGIGGRLGFTAFLATSIVTFLNGSPSTGLSTAPAVSLSALKQSTILPMAMWHAVGSIATIVLREASDDSAAADPVRASAVIGLIGALLLKDKSAALAVYGGSFVGMSLPSRLMHGILPGKAKQEGTPLPPVPSVFSLLASFGIAGALGGIVHGATIDWGFWPGGWGGKAGTCAFTGCLIYRALSKVCSFIGKEQS